MTDFPYLAGFIDNRIHHLPVRIYWEDTDGGGIVYHANYLKFMERGRSDLLRVLGINQMQVLKDTGVAVVVSRMDMVFKRPAQLDDVVLVKTQVTKRAGATVALEQSVWRNDELLVQAQVTVAAIREGRPVRLPADFVSAFEPVL